MRSINTTVVALLPVAGLLFIGGGFLGAGMLNDISLSLFVGLAAGAYSSIFIATPLVADLKEREPQMKALKKRVLAKRAAAAAKGESPGRRRGRTSAATTRRRGPPRSSGRAASPRPAAGAAADPRASADDRTTYRELLLSRITDVPDYPKPGVMFKDITPLLADPAAFRALTDALAELCGRHGADKIVGLEARGFILAAPVAVRAGHRLRAGPQGRASCPARRSAQAYELEYGTAEIEIHAEDLAAGRPGPGHRRRPRHRRHRRGLAGADPAGRRRGRGRGGPAWSSASSPAGPAWSRRCAGAPLEALITV